MELDWVLLRRLLRLPPMVVATPNINARHLRIIMLSWMAVPSCALVAVHAPARLKTGALMARHPQVRCAVAVITPIGPFCPFRSAACADGGFLGKAMSELTQSRMPHFATEMARLELDMRAGSMPDPEKMRALASDLAAAEEEWRTMLTRMRLADDFQSREYLKLTEAVRACVCALDTVA